MYAPKLYDTERSRDMIQEFRGYNHNLRIGDNEFYDMKNMTSNYYPVLSPREKRGIVKKLDGSCQGILAKEKKLAYIVGNKLYYGTKPSKDLLTLNEERQLLSMGSTLLIVPDWLGFPCFEEINDPSTEIVFDLANNVEFWLCDKNGQQFGVQFVQSKEPNASASTHGAYWVNTSFLPDGKPVLHECVATDEGRSFGWKTVKNRELSLLLRILNPMATIIGESNTIKEIRILDRDDRTNQTVLFNNDQDWELTETYFAKDVFGSIKYIDILISDTCFNYGITKKGDAPLWIDSYYEPKNGTLNLTLEDYAKWFPLYDFVLENQNRIWLCRYGENRDGDTVNEIRASALGTFMDWSKSSAISDGSYTVSIGSDGPFTGAITYQGHPIFFKENCYHIVYGSYPSNYQVVTENGYGVQKGSEKSLCIINGILYYKAPDGVYRFDGASHEKISEALGFEKYKDAVGGTVDGKYYLAMTAEDGTRSIFVYDTRKGLWHKEDDVNVVYFASYNGDLYFVEREDSTDYLGTIKGTEGEKEDDVEWFAETGIIGYSTPDSKYVGKLQVRLMLPIGSRVNFYVEYDSDGYMEFVGGLEGTSLRSFTLPILPRRCDHFKIRIEGVGECKIFSLCKVLEDGGEL